MTTFRAGNGWANKRDGAARASKHFGTQREAIDAARTTRR
ncbi:DUF2188 domain-containing protein [Corynebacterium pseudogenitalium]